FVRKKQVIPRIVAAATARIQRSFASRHESQTGTPRSGGFFCVHPDGKVIYCSCPVRRNFGDWATPGMLGGTLFCLSSSHFPPRLLTVKAAGRRSARRCSESLRTEVEHGTQRATDLGLGSGSGPPLRAAWPDAGFLAAGAAAQHRAPDLVKLLP